MRRYTAPALALLALAACINPVENGGPPIPAGSLVFTFEPSILAYHLADSTNNTHFILDWIPPAFSGYNCLGLLPNAAPGDTAGSFVFSWSGRNIGFLSRFADGVTDTTTGYFFPAQSLGTHGSYVIDSSNKMTMSWVDGTRSRYFQPAADIRLRADSIISNVDLKTRGDSIHEVWHVVWVFSGGTGC